MKQINLKVVLSVAAVAQVFASVESQAYPLLSSFAESVNGRVLFYQDHNPANKNKYWYFSNVIDPVENLDGTVSQPVIRRNYLYYAYSGQAQVRKSDLVAFAEQKGISLTDLAPVPFEKTEATACQNLDASKVSIQIPPRVGSFLEHLPVTVSTRDPDAVDILTEALSNGSGINCYASVQYKVVADQHTIHFEVAMDDVYSKLEVGTYARYWIFEADLKTTLKSYARDGLIKVIEFQEGDYQKPVAVDPNSTSKSAEDIFNTVFDLVIKQLLVRKTSIPDAAGIPNPGSGALFSLRANYQRSTERFSFKGDYAMQGTKLHESLIQIRVAPKQ